MSDAFCCFFEAHQSFQSPTITTSFNQNDFLLYSHPGDEVFNTTIWGEDTQTFNLQHYLNKASLIRSSGLSWGTKKESCERTHSKETEKSVWCKVWEERLAIITCLVVQELSNSFVTSVCSKSSSFCLLEYIDDLQHM